MFKVKFKFNCILVDIIVNHFKYIGINGFEEEYFGQFSQLFY